MNRILELDALRGYAALMVVFFHYTMGKPAAKLGFEVGITGVDLFFMISGFVIFMSITNSKSIKDFILKRVFRLYPAYWFAVSFTAVLIYYKGYEVDGLIPRYLGNLTMFQSYMGLQDIDGPYWTLIVEMLFYILIILIMLTKRTQYVIYVGYSIIGFLLFNELVIQPIDGNFFDNFNWHSYWRFPLLGHFPLFFAGILFYKQKTEGETIPRYIGIAIAYVTALLICDNFGRSKDYISTFQIVFMLTLYFIAFVLFVKGKLGFIVNKRSLFLGRISYSLYLIHQYVGIAIIVPILVWDVKIGEFQATVYALIAAILLATFMTFYIEEPAMKYLKKKFIKR